MDEKSVDNEHVAQLARLALTGDRQNVETYLRRLLRTSSKANPALAEQISQLLASAPDITCPLRDVGGGHMPVDQDSRLSLLKHENPVVIDHEPILPPTIADSLNLVITERSCLERLAKNNLRPIRTLLFTGPPGVGKTLSARWVAAKLEKPLLTLDLATVISSYLGRTGINLRNVLDYAKTVDAVLLLDEFDAIAKRRGDETELGELKRIVTVLLQEIDAWPNDRLLIAATNHGELLDRAVWRRFDFIFEFPLPTPQALERTINVCFSELPVDLGKWRDFLMEFCRGKPFSDIEQFANHIRRRMIVGKTPLEEAIVETMALYREGLTLSQRKDFGPKLAALGFSDRRINDLIGISRDTLRTMRRKTKTKKVGA